MKRNNTTRTSMGLTQSEMAQLLGISRGQWAMFEIGKRRLPQQVEERYTQLAVHVAQQETERKERLTGRTINPELLPTLEHMLLRNQYRRNNALVKLAKASRQRDTAAKLTHVNQFLAQEKAARGTASKKPTPPPASQPDLEKGLSHHTSKILELELRLEVLAFEEELLRGKMGEIKGGMR